MREVTVWYLESNSATELHPAPNPGGIDVGEARVKQYQFNRFLYQLVGATWEWHDKLAWTDAQWQTYAEADELRTWVAWCEGSPAGYFELQARSQGVVEICYLGLAEKFLGRGFGSYLLSEAIRQAWTCGASRVSVNTCSLDHPNALRNYQARGMSIYRTDVERRE